MSFKAIDSEIETDDQQWLTYWVVFSVFSILENAGGMFFLSYIPFYFVMKIAFFIWLYHPRYLGAVMVYNQLLRPVVLPQLEKFSSKIEKKAA